MKPAANPTLCVVVPCYNEEEALPAFFATAAPALEAATGGRWLIVCVDDGSRDTTFEFIARQHAIDGRVTGVRLSRNFGHQAAVSVGLAFANGDYVGVVDCDLQDPIEVLLDLYRTAVTGGLDVCYGIRARRDAPLMLRLAYSLFYRVVDHLADHHWPKDAGDFCVISRRCHQVLLSLPEHSRMMRGLRAWVGFKQAGIPYHRPARLHGTSKYNLRRLWALAMQGLIAFSSIPLRLASMIGLVMTVVSLLFGLLVLINRLFPKFTILGYWVGANAGVTSILLFGTLITSVMFLCLGIIGEYMIVMFQELKRRPTAVVDAVLGAVAKADAAVHINDVGVSQEKKPPGCSGMPVIYKSAPVPVGMAPEYFELASPSHFWCRRRFEVLQALAGGLIAESSQLAEIGCGNGVLQRQIEDAYGIAVAGFDLHEAALQRNMSCLSPIYCYDIHDKAQEFRARFNMIFLFDVLEHIADEDRFLESVKFHLAGNGSIAINVPAQQWLYSEYDRVQGHHRRYSRKGVCDLARRCGFVVRQATYWGAPLVPLLAFRKLVVRTARSQSDSYTRGFAPQGDVVNRLFMALSRCERVPQQWTGTSVMAILGWEH